MSVLHFQFGNEAYAKEAPVITVTQPLPYTAEQGWGFVTEKIRREQELLRLPELNSGFEAVWWYQDEDITQLEMREEGCLIADCIGTNGVGKNYDGKE